MSFGIQVLSQLETHKGTGDLGLEIWLVLRPSSDRKTPCQSGGPFSFVECRYAAMSSQTLNPMALVKRVPLFPHVNIPCKNRFRVL